MQLTTAGRSGDEAHAAAGQSTALRFRRGVTAASAGAAAIGFIGLLGYVTGTWPVEALRADYIPMPPTTAICFLILGLALFRDARAPWQGSGRLTMFALDALVVMLGVLAASGTAIHLEDALLPEWGTIHAIPVGHMSPATGITFVVAGASAALTLLRPVELRRAASAGHLAATLGILVVLVGTTFLLAYVYGAPLLYGGTTIPMAATSAMAFVFLGSALVAAAGPAAFPACHLTGDSTAARLSRVFLPFTVAVVLIVGATTYRESSLPLVNQPLILAALAVVVAVLTVLLIGRVAHTIGGRLDESNRMLRAAESRYRRFIETTHEGFSEIDPAGRVLTVNESLGRMFGLAVDEMIGLKVSDLMFPEDAALMSERLQRRAQGAPDSYEQRFRTKSGAVVWLLVSATPVRDEHGVVRGSFAMMVDITERKHMEAELRESERLLSESQRLGHVGSFLADSSYRVAWSDELYRLCGVDPATFALTFESFLGLLHPDDRQSMQDWIAACMAGEKQAGIEYRINMPDGTTRFLEGSGEAVHDAANQLSYMAGTVRDITESRKAEEALRESEAKFRAYVEHAPDGMFVIDAAGFYLDVNAAGCKLVGYAREELLHMHASEIVAEGTREQVGKRLGSLRRDGTYSGEFTFLRKDGTTFTGLLDATTIGENRYLGFLKDITERKRAEDAIRRGAEMLQRAEATAHVGYYQIDVRTGSATWSEETFRIFGLDPSGGEPSVEGYQALIHPDDAATLYEHFAASIEERKPFVLTYRILHSGGEVRHVHSIGHVETDAAGAVVRMVGTLQDVTERTRAEEERATLQAELQQAQKMESVGRLAGGVAHDFNNMLSVILNNAEFAMEQVDASDPLHGDLEEIHAAAVRSADLTRQLLAFARKQTVAPKAVDLNESVTSMLKMLRRLIGEDLDLSWRPGAELWPAFVDPAQVDQALANLCVNARDAIANVGCVTLETDNRVIDAGYCARHQGAVPGDYVCLVVADDGCGMDADTLVHVFEPFYTTKEMGKGTGLGLATVYGIMKQNGGFIDVESQRGVGSRFTLYFPRHECKAGQAAAAWPATPAERGHETILLVEDEPAILRTTRLMLERQGYAVLAARTPGEAMSVARDHAGEIHLLVTDVIMPEMNGRDLAKSMLSLYPWMKRLYMSGYTADVIAHHGMLEDGVSFMQKPFDRDALAAKVRGVLDGA